MCGEKNPHSIGTNIMSNNKTESIIELRLNGVPLCYMNTCNAVSADYLAFMDAILNALSLDKASLKHVFNSEKYPISWIIQLGKNEVAFRRVINGRIDEDYAPVNYVKANVYAAAILNSLQPPRDLRLSDKPIG